MKTIVVLWNAMRYSAGVVLQSGGGADRFHRIRHGLPSSPCHLFVASDKFYSTYSVNLNLILHPSTSHMTVSSWRIAISFVLKPLEFGNACHQLACENNDNADALMELFLIRDNFRSYNLPNFTLQVQDGFMMLLLLVAKDS